MSPRQRRLALVLCLFGALLAAAFILVRQAGPDTTQPGDGVTAPTAAAAAASSGRADPPAIADAHRATAAALDAARRISDPRTRAREFGRLLLDWLARDLDAAVAYVRSLPAGPEFTQGLLMALDAVGQRDPDRALTLAGELAVTREQQAFYSAFFARLGTQGIDGALHLLARVPPGEGRANALRAVADVWTRMNLPAALAWAEGLADPTDRSVAFESVLAELSASDPLRVLSLAPSALRGPALGRTLALALQKLSETDGESAAAIARLLPAGETRTHATALAARAMSARAPADALAWMDALPEAGLQRLALSNILDVWLRKDAPTARQYVESLPAGPTKDAAASQVGRVLGGGEPPAAIAWAGALGSGSAQDAAYVSIASAWAEKDPAAASRWARDLPAPTVRNEALGGALSYWVLQDARAAREFVSTISGDLQAQAAGAIAPALAQTDPAATMMWAQALSQPAAREQAVAAAFARWVQNSPAAARAWLDSASVSPETRAMLGRR